MNYETVLLIGGPKDGARMSVPEGIPYIRCVVLPTSPARISHINRDVPKCVTVEEATYRLELMHSSMGFKGAVYVFDNGVDALPALIEGYRKPPVWNSAEIPPPGESGLWSAEVVAVTNHGNAFTISYFRGDESGVWQRPKAFLNGEKVEYWMPLP